jgi:hypothetical protein
VKIAEDGKISYRILLWGSVLKNNYYSSLNNYLQLNEADFFPGKYFGEKQKINSLFWETKSIQLKKNPNISFELYNISHRENDNNSRKYSIIWTDDYAEEHEKALKEIFFETDGIIFVVDANRLIEDHKSFEQKFIDGLEQTQKSLHILKKVAGDSLFKNIPLISVLINPIPQPGQNKPEIINKSDLEKILDRMGHSYGKEKIFESKLLSTNLPTKVYPPFLECVRLIGINSQILSNNSDKSNSESTLDELFST